MIDPNNLPESSLRTAMERSHMLRLLSVVLAILAVVVVTAIVLLIIG